MKRIYQVTALAGAILAGAGGLAVAAGGPDGKAHRGGHHQMHTGGQWGGHGGGFHKASFHRGGAPGFSMRHIDGSIAFLKAELKITEAQEPQWQQLETALRSSGERMSELRKEMRGDRPQRGERGERGPRGDRAERGERGDRAARADGAERAERPQRERMNPVERLERMEKVSSAAAESAREVRTALEPLYDSMSDDQKETADKLLRRAPFRR